MRLKNSFKLMFVLFSFFAVQTIVGQYSIPDKPKLQTSVYDYIELLSSSEKRNLEQKLIRYSDSTSTQIVVAIISTTKGESIGVLAPRWGHKWGVGQAKEDNGVFILLAKDDREIWISPGYGVEHLLSAGITGELTREVIIPEFKKGDYYAGLDKIKSIMNKIGDFEKAGFNKIPSKKPKSNPKDLFGLLPKSRADQYDMYEVINRLVDNSEIEEYKADYGKTIITAYARIDGWAVGITFRFFGRYFIKACFFKIPDLIHNRFDFI